MAKLEDLTPGAAVRGILPDSIVTVVAADWFGANAIRLTYTDAAGRPGQQLLYRDNEPTLEIARTGRPWSFDGDGALLRLVSEAYRIKLAYLFDPYLAVQTSLVEEVLQHVVGLVGADVKVALEIQAELPNGAPDQVVRTVTENCRTLKFKSFGFEDA